jgi:hypothetical protein
MDWNVDSEVRIEPPIQTRNFLSGGAITRIFMVLGARAITYFDRRSGMPGNMVLPPLITIFPYRSFRTSTSQFMMDW